MTSQQTIKLRPRPTPNQAAHQLLMLLIERFGLNRRRFLDQLADLGYAFNDDDFTNWGRPGRSFPRDWPALQAMLQIVTDNHPLPRRCRAGEALKFLGLVGMPFPELRELVALFPADEFDVALAAYIPFAAALLLLLTVAATGFALVQLRNARQRAAEAQNLALVSGAQAALNKGSTDQALALALITEDAGVIWWDIDKGILIRRFTGHGAGIRELSFSPDGHQLVSGSADTSVRIWDLQDGAQMNAYRGHASGDAQGILGLALSPDGTRALSSGGDQEIVLWNIATGAQLQRLKGHKSVVNAIAFSPDGRTALSGAGAGDNQVILWDLANGTEIRRFEGHKQDVYTVAICVYNTLYHFLSHSL